MFLTRAVDAEWESRGHPSLSTTLMRPMSSAAFQWSWYRSSWRKCGNFRLSCSPDFVNSAHKTRISLDAHCGLNHQRSTEAMVNLMRPCAVAAEIADTAKVS